MVALFYGNTPRFGPVMQALPSENKIMVNFICYLLSVCLFVLFELHFLLYCFYVRNGFTYLIEYNNNTIYGYLVLWTQNE